jgi:hypothetical protein
MRQFHWDPEPYRERVELRVGRLEEPLPVAAALAPGGRFVLADVVVPDDPADVVTPIDGVYDVPSTVAEQLAWMREASLDAGVAWLERDRAVLVGRG